MGKPHILTSTALVLVCHMQWAGSQGASEVAMVCTTIFDMLIAPGGRAGNFYNSAPVVGGHGGGTITDAQ